MGGGGGGGGQGKVTVKCLKGDELIKVSKKKSLARGKKTQKWRLNELGGVARRNGGSQDM